MWRQLSKWAKLLPGLETHSVHSFAKDLEAIPYTLTLNAGLKSIATNMVMGKHYPLGQFNCIRGFASSGGRNSAGRITSFHRGGGVKRLPRNIDVKRSNSAMGVIEKIEYDPNRSARIALVRWVEGVKLHRRQCNVKDEFTPPSKMLEPTTTTIRGLFSFSSMPGKVVQRKVACASTAPMVGYAAVGFPTTMTPLSNDQISTKSKNNCARDVFMSAFSKGAMGETASISSVVPRIVVAGAKPPSFSLQMRENLEDKNSFSLNEVQKWRKDSSFWTHKIKRKAAISWLSLRHQLSLGLVRAAEHDEPKLR